ncbi:DUF4962 domain-containing protein [Candidatus Poribacteria bacterium]|nr:DUF4962 domain-containing protein [Candidatus Poribacteria bacterium]
MRVTREGRGAVYVADGLPDPAHVPDVLFDAGEYVWTVEATDATGRVLDTFGPRQFTLASGAPEQRWVDAQELLARVPPDHPRVIFTRDGLTDLRASAATTRREPFEALISKADSLLDIRPPDEPTYDSIADPSERKMAYTWGFRDFRGVIDNGMEPLALAYLFTGRRPYGEAALRILRHVARWDVDGVSSIMAPYGDEIGLSLVKVGAHCYDWLHDLMTDEDDRLIRAMLIARGDQMLRRLRDRHDFLASPGESHAGRLPGYLCEHAIACRDAPEAAAWLDYALRALMTVFPHWGGPDGGWAEGIGYGRAYNTIFLPPFEAVRAATGLNLWERPFFRKVRKFFFYCTSPIGEVTPFGDGGSTGNARGGAGMMIHHANVFGDGAARWWADHANPDARRSSHVSSLILADTVEPAAPEGEPSDAAFRGVGWAAMHGDIRRPDADTLVLLKSSPYGSTSHSHADQNAIAILKGGKALATSSGYYGPSYGMPHHAEWTRQTKAHCGVLVDGEGQVDRSADAVGRIARFEARERMGYVVGDAAAAYGGRLARFDRHVVLVRPGFVLVMDDLAAPAPVSYAWLLHAFDPFEIDAARQTVVSTRGEARLTVGLRSAGDLAITQTDEFETPYNAGTPATFREERPNHHHLTATTGDTARETRIVAAMVAEASAGEYDLVAQPAPDGWVAWSAAGAGGIVECVAQVTPGTPLPADMPHGSIARVTWAGVDGAADELILTRP